MSYAVIGILLSAAALCWGDRKNWREYYPTMLYFVIADKVYDVLTVKKPMWYYGELLGHYPWFDVAISMLLYPATVLLYLSFLPKRLTFPRVGGYMLLWIVAYTVLEWIAYLTGGFVYQNGWNLLYSTLFNVVMFAMLYLHYKKPLLAWPVSGVCAFAFLLLMGIPFRK